MNKELKRIIVAQAAAILFGSASLYAATPVITNISVNSFIQGSAVIILGSHLQDTDLSGLELSQSQSNFEGAGFSSDGWAEVVDYGNTGALTLDKSVFLTGAQSFCTRVFRCGLETGGGYRCGAFLRDYPRAYNQPMTNVYVRYYVRYSRGFQWPNNYVKQFYFHGTSAGFVLQPRLGATGYFSAQPNISYYNFPKPMAEERWYCVEGRFGADGSGEMWLDGKSMGTGGPGPNPGGWYYFEIGMPNASTFSTDPDSKIWFDGMNLSATRRIYPEAQVFLANGPIFSTATKVSQELLYISDTSIRFKVDVNGLGTGPHYLFVVNNRNECSAPFLSTTAINPGAHAFHHGADDRMWSQRGNVFFRTRQSGAYTLSAYDAAGKLVWMEQGNSAADETRRMKYHHKAKGLLVTVLEQTGTRSIYRIPVLAP